MTVIEKLRTIIKDKDLTQKNLADLMGITETTINNYLTNRTKLDVETLIKISEVLNVPITEFFVSGDFQVNEHGNNIGSQKNVKKLVNGNVTIHTNTVKEQENEIEKMKLRIDALTDKILEKDTLLDQKEKIIEDKQKFLDQVIAGKERQIARITEEKEKQLEIREEEITRIIDEKEKQLKIREEEITRIIEEKEKQILLLNRMIEMLEKQGK